MTAATITPPPAPTPRAAPPAGPVRHLWTIEQYRKLDATGVFGGMKTFLIHGELFTMVMPGPLHDVSLTKAFRFALAACPAGHYVRNQQGFDIGLRNDPGPDLAVVVGEVDDYVTRTPTAAVWVIEVSDTSLDLDTTTKAELYATAGVPDYWVVDVTNRQLLVFRDPVPLPKGLGATAYRTKHVFGPADAVAPLANSAASTTVAGLLPR